MFINYKDITVNLDNVCYLYKNNISNKSFEIYFKTNDSSITFDFDNYEERDKCLDIIHANHTTIKIKPDEKK